MTMKRRTLLGSIAAVGTAAAVGGVAPGCNQPPLEPDLAGPPRSPDSDRRQRTACAACGGGCGVLVRVLDAQRCVMVEGDPDDPVGRGGVCPNGLAEIQHLYNPDRLLAPMRRTGAPGSDGFEAIDGGAAVAQVADAIDRLVRLGRGDRVAIIYGERRDRAFRVARRLARSLGASFDPTPGSAAPAWEQAWGGPLALPSIEQAAFVLFLGASWLERGPNVVVQMRDFAEMRRGRAAHRGSTVAVDPRLGVSAAKADRWIPCRPGRLGAVALGLARLVVDMGAVHPAAAESLGGPEALAFFLDRLRTQVLLDEVVSQTGVELATLEGMARALVERHPSLVVPGEALVREANASAALKATLALNALIGALANGDAGWRPQAPDPFEDASLPAAGGARLLARLAGTEGPPVEVLLLLRANPVYDSPDGSSFAGALANVPLVVSLAPYLDESGRFSHLVLPECAGFEQGDLVLSQGTPGRTVVTAQRPLIPARGKARPADDWLVAIGSKLEAQAAPSPFRDSAEVRAWEAEALALATGRSAAEIDEALEKEGRLFLDGARAPATLALGTVEQWIPAALAVPDLHGPASAYPLVLHVFDTLGARGYALAQPHIVETCDALFHEKWHSWAEIHPRTAGELGLADRDWVRVSTSAGSGVVRLRVHRGVLPGVVGVPEGFGRGALGRWATNLGLNAHGIIAAVRDPASGLHGRTAERARVERVVVEGA